MPELVAVLTQEEIEKKVAGLAQRISSDYANRPLILIGVLKGAFVFLADLARRLSIPVQIDFVRVSSYGCGTDSSKDVCLSKDVELDVRAKDLLIVEDIVDTGISLAYLIDSLQKKGPKSIKVCALIDKRERREIGIPLEYAGHVAEEGFLVGYGLDYAEDFRHLPGIYHLKT